MIVLRQMDSGGHDITITVVDQDENPVQGKITLFGPDAGIVGERELDENGQAMWEVFEDGEYTYNIYEVTGYEPVSDDSSFEVTEDTELTVEMQAIDERTTMTSRMMVQNAMIAMRTPREMRRAVAVPSRTTAPH